MYFFRVRSHLKSGLRLEIHVSIVKRRSVIRCFVNSSRRADDAIIIDKIESPTLVQQFAGFAQDD